MATTALFVYVGLTNERGGPLKNFYNIKNHSHPLNILILRTFAGIFCAHLFCDCSCLQNFGINKSACTLFINDCDNFWAFLFITSEQGLLLPIVFVWKWCLFYVICQNKTKIWPLRFEQDQFYVKFLGVNISEVSSLCTVRTVL